MGGGARGKVTGRVGVMCWPCRCGGERQEKTSATWERILLGKKLEPGILKPQSSPLFLSGDPLEQLVRHFLIETGPKGVKIKGCPSEPYFGEKQELGEGYVGSV